MEGESQTLKPIIILCILLLPCTAPITWEDRILSGPSLTVYIGVFRTRINILDGVFSKKAPSYMFVKLLKMPPRIWSEWGNIGSTVRSWRPGTKNYIVTSHKYASTRHILPLFGMLLSGKRFTSENTFGMSVIKGGCMVVL